MGSKRWVRFAASFFVAFVVLVCSVCSVPSAQAECWITIDGVPHRATLETSRTMQVAEEAYDFEIKWRRQQIDCSAPLAR